MTLTVAVKVTVWPNTEELAEETTVVVVAVVCAGEWKTRMPSTWLSPPSAAMMLWLPVTELTA